MLVYALKRVVLAILVSPVVSALVFSLLYMTEDPATALAGENATDVDIAAIRAA